MKKLILPALLALSISANAQLSTREKDTYFSVSVGADIRNGILGSNPTNNKPALNWITEFHAVSQNVDITIGYEEFAQIKYSRMIFGLGYHFPLYAYLGNTEIKTTFIPSLEASIIKRTYTDHYTYQGKQLTEERTPGFLAYGLNLAFNWDLSDSFAIQTATNIIHRPDKEFLYGEKDRWVLSNYLKVVYKFNKG